MKRTFTLLCAMGFVVGTYAQTDTILHENFNETGIEDRVVNDFPQGDPTGTFLNFDVDGVGDGSGTDRSAEWFLTFGFANVDTLDTVMASNSWLQGGATAENWLMTPAIFLEDGTGMLSWESAPFQTPLYLDGYVVLLSTTNNIETSFTDTLFLAAEYQGGSGSDFGAYTFSDGWVHGMDGQYIMQNDTSDVDSARWTGILAPHSVSLADYAGQTIYIAFVHNSTDDNLLTIDDITVTGNGSTFSISESSVETNLNVFPNPATEQVNISFDVPESSPVVVEIFDVTGKLADRVSAKFHLKGHHNIQYDVNNLDAGLYVIRISSKFGNQEMKLMVQ